MIKTLVGATNSFIREIDSFCHPVTPSPCHPVTPSPPSPPPPLSPSPRAPLSPAPTSPHLPAPPTPLAPACRPPPPPPVTPSPCHPVTPSPVTPSPRPSYWPRAIVSAAARSRDLREASMSLGSVWRTHSHSAIASWKRPRFS